MFYCLSRKKSSLRETPRFLWFFHGMFPMIRPIQKRFYFSWETLFGRDMGVWSLQPTHAEFTGKLQVDMVSTQIFAIIYIQLVYMVWNFQKQKRQKKIERIGSFLKLPFWVEVRALYLHATPATLYSNSLFLFFCRELVWRKTQNPMLPNNLEDQDCCAPVMRFVKLQLELPRQSVAVAEDH